MRHIQSRTRRTLAALAFVLVVTPVVGALPARADASDCKFIGGFRQLHDLIPDIVGDCIENEQHNPTTGDALQRTTRGLLVWRKADNWTAFTDGVTTWVNGPNGIQSRSNAERFPWEAASAPPPPPPSSESSPSTSAPRSDSAPAPAVQSGPIQKDPASLLLVPEDMGKQITQAYVKTGADERGGWAEARYVRGEELINAKLGPIQIVNRVYVASNVDAARAIYRDEVNKQSTMPEHDQRFGTVYVNEGDNAVVQVGEEQDSRAACNDDCNTKDFNRLHQRTVMRYQNVVAVIYFWGARDQATPAQMNEWLSKVRSRIG